jgi:hypothetical protein
MISAVSIVVSIYKEQWRREDAKCVDEEKIIPKNQDNRGNHAEQRTTKKTEIVKTIKKWTTPR